MKFRIRRQPATRRYECFECGAEHVSRTTLDACDACGEIDNFYQMH